MISVCPTFVRSLAAETKPQNQVILARRIMYQLKSNYNSGAMTASEAVSARWHPHAVYLVEVSVHEELEVAMEKWTHGSRQHNCPAFPGLFTGTYCFPFEASAGSAASPGHCSL